MKDSTAASRVSGRIFWLASLMFFLSGGTGLAYQVIWFKRFSQVWGSSSLAFASVGASFLFGLGVGAWLIGRYADSAEEPLRWYGVCELAIGLAALAISFEIQWLTRLSAGFYSHLPDEPLLRYLTQFGITLAVVGPPCILMGGTLPLLIRELTSREGALDQATGWLYALNTFGAAAGCYVTGFHLLPTLGLLRTNNLAAGLNIGIGLVAVLVSGRAPKRRPARARSAHASAEVAGRGYALVRLYIAVALAGLAALVLEMTWSRQLALVLGGSSYAYSATLFVVLVGIASGSLLFHAALRPAALNPWLLILVIGALAIACLAGKSALPWLSSQVAAYRGARQTLLGNAAVCVAASALLELIPALAMGILFPLFVDLTKAQASRVGRTVGDVYAWNTFGSILGASLTTIVLFPHIGTGGAIALATALYVATLLLVLPLETARDRGRALGSLAIGGALVAGIMIPQDPRRTNLGDIYGSQTDILDKLQSVYFVEGASSNVLVVKYEGKSTSLRVNGKADASDGVDMTTQLGLAYVPMLFCPRVREVLVIGFGSGTTPGASLLFPESRVTCCEIEPAVYGAAEYFSQANHRPQDHTRQFLRQRNSTLPPPERLSDEQIDRQARLRMVFGDGRTQLQGDDQKYDLIISEPSNPWMAGVSSLFTREFFAAAKEHLNSGGVLAQWIQTYHFTLDDYLMIVRTLRSVFPHCGLVALSRGSDTVLLASDTPLLPDRARLDEVQGFVDSSPEVSADLRNWFGTSDLRVVLLSHYSIPQETLDKLVAAAPTNRVNTDLNMRLEFEAPLHLFVERLPPEISAHDQLAALASAEWTAHLAPRMGVALDSAEYQLAQGLVQLHRGQVDAAMPFLQKALEIKPQLADVYRALGDLLKRQGNEQQVIAVLQAILKAQPDSAEVRLALFDAYVAAGENDAAVPVIEPLRELVSATAGECGAAAMRLTLLNRSADAADFARKALQLDPSLALNPNNLSWVNNYAWRLATDADPAVRNGEEAVRFATLACQAVNYEQWTILDTLGAAYAEAGRFDEARQTMQRVLDRAQRDGDAAAADLARRRLALYAKEEPCREQDEVVIRAP